MGLHRTVIQSFKYALSGIGFAVVNNLNMQIHLLATLVVFCLAWFFKIQKGEFLALVVVIVLVMSAEMINTSIEEMTNLITKEHRREAKIAKDVSAGMVLVVSIGAVIVGLYIFIPYILLLIQ